MYEAHFGLGEMPFALTPDPDFLFMHRQHQAALQTLLAALAGVVLAYLVATELLKRRIGAA